MLARTWVPLIERAYIGLILGLISRMSFNNLSSFHRLNAYMSPTRLIDEAYIGLILSLMSRTEEGEFQQHFSFSSTQTSFSLFLFDS